MAIEYVYNTSFVLKNEKSITSWINDVIVSEKHVLGDLIFAFFSDEDLRQINIKHLKQDYYTDVISFDASESGRVSGNIAVSIDRVKENAKTYDSSFDNELYRVMVHGVLHCVGYNDNTKEEKERIRKAENLKLKMFHVEQ
ncbi:MAG: rRNA maturation RNase YbeY [Flavobacteriaceae bacterium]|jgi:rRNA maturation RNase YbeY|nr:rRNA maturation RNase YbeY [Pelagibacterales bacterium]MBT4709265.1 rRNA maturation RNase YbeY [Flavobacteriaceae bacterium]